MGNVIRNIVELLVISIMVVMGISTAFLIMNDGGNDVEFQVENQTFKTASSMDFSSVTIDSSFIQFNDTGFYIDSTNEISISISFINSNINSASDGDSILSFDADTSSGIVWFNISGFMPGTSYSVQKDSVDFSTVTANSSGFISFSNDEWSSHTFDVYQDGDANSAPNAATNPIPSDGSSDISTSVSLSVDITDPDGDAMDVSFFDASDDSVINTDTSVSSGGTATVTWSGLSYNTEYSWYVIGNDGLVDGDVSSTWSFTTESAPNSPPYSPSSPSPSDGAVNVSIEPVLSWSGGDPDGDDVTYDIYFSTSNPPESKIASNQSSSTHSPGSLSYDQTYYWKIDSWDEFGEKTIGSVWSFRTIAADEEDPTFSNSMVNSSDPVDTLIGWKNITCQVSDNVLVDSVKLNITYPNGSIENVSMVSNADGSYFYNDTFSSFGACDYFFYAVDTSGNENSTSTDSFTIFANWDINMDGECNNLDLIAISNLYGTSGDIGWVREDVDNNGVIQVLDLSIASSHFGDSYEI